MRCRLRAPCAIAVLALACSKESRQQRPDAAANSFEVDADAVAKAAFRRDAADNSAARPKGPWNVVLITVDSLRADMPWAGYQRPIAPRLSALHARAVSYPHAYSTSSFTSKSIPGLLTGH